METIWEGRFYKIEIAPRRVGAHCSRPMICRFAILCFFFVVALPEMEGNDFFSRSLKNVDVRGDIKTRGSRRRLEVKWAGRDENGRLAARTVMNFEQGSLPRRIRCVTHFYYYDYTNDTPGAVNRGWDIGGGIRGFRKTTRKGFKTRFAEVRFKRAIQWQSTKKQTLRGKAFVRFSGFR